MLARLVFALFLGTCALPADAFHPGHAHHTRAEGAVLTAETWDDFVPHGKEVDAIYGDVALCNPYLTAVIAEPKASRNANMTVRNVGGSLIDLTVNDSPSDQLSAFYPHRRKYNWTSRALKSGQEEQTVNGVSKSQSYVELTLRCEATDTEPAVELVYRLEQNDRFLTVISRLTNSTAKPLTVDLEDDLRADANGEDMLKSPNGRHDLFYFQDTYWGQAYGIEVDGRKVVSQSDARNSILKYIDDGESQVTLEPGQTFELKRRVFPGADLVEVKANWHASRGKQPVPVKLAFRAGDGQPIPRANVSIDADDIPVGNGRANADGEYSCRLIPGKYVLEVAALGVKLSESKTLTIEVAEAKDAQAFAFDFATWKPGAVSAAITDDKGNPIPCKVAFHATGETPKPYFAPKSAAFGVIDIYYTPNGTFTQQLPSGTYDVIISRGPEYDAIFTELTITPGETTSLTGKLVRSVDTRGWVSSDFHSHSSPSGDNTGSQLGRVLSLICEQIEFAPCTEHNRIDTYVPHIQALGLEAHVTTVSGMELTGSPLPLNHQNVFPLKHRPRTQDGGGPVTDVEPEAQIERIFLWDDRSDKLIQQNHPDIGWLFFDKNGDGIPDAGFERTHGLIDVMEIHPIHLVLDLGPVAEYNGKPYANRVFGWLQLLNQGYRIPGVVNTDAHYNYHESGGLRNWIASSTDDPGNIDVNEMIHMSEQGRLVMSNGPFLQFAVRETGRPQSLVGPGQDLSAKSKRVTASVKVQCPNWIDIDRVFLLVNGQPHEVHNYRRDQHPEMFKSGVVKFEAELELELETDAHIIAVAGNGSAKLGKIMGPLWGNHEPAAVTNPVFVDIDGNGFTPNKDTLDHPLPVKFGVKP